MATKLEIIITYDQDSKKCAIEWTTVESQDVTAKEKNNPCSAAEIKRACDTADLIILLMMRQDQDKKPFHRRL